MSVLIILVCIIGSSLFQLVGEDFYFIIKTGEYIWNHGLFYEDVFTMHQGLSFQAEQWLSNIVFYKIFENFGQFGVGAFVTLCFCLTGLVYYALYKRYGGEDIVPVLIVLFITGMGYARERPQCISMLLSVLYLYAMERFREDKRWGVVAVICSILTINFHGALWFILPCISMCFVLEYYKEWKEQLALLSIVIASSFVNPYHVDMIGFIFGPLTDGIYHNINEMMPATIFQGGGIIMSVFLLLSLKKKLPLRHILLFGGFWIMALMAARGYLQLLLLGTPAVLAAHQTHLNINYVTVGLAILTVTAKPSVSYFMNSIYIVIAIGLVWKVWNTQYRNLAIVCMLLLCIYRPFIMPTENQYTLSKIPAIEKMTTYPSGTVYTVHGSIFEYFGYKPYMDGRFELYSKSKNKKADIMGEYQGIQKGHIYFPDFVEKYKFDYIFVQIPSIEETYMRDVKGYKLIDVSEKTKLYERVSR